MGTVTAAYVGLFRGSHCSRSSVHTITSASKAHVAYSAYSNDIHQAGFAVVEFEKGLEAKSKADTLICHP